MKPHYSNTVAPRPAISMCGDRVYLNGGEARVVLCRGKISVGCTDVSPEVLRHLLNEYE